MKDTFLIHASVPNELKNLISFLRMKKKTFNSRAAPETCTWRSISEPEETHLDPPAKSWAAAENPLRNFPMAWETDTNVFSTAREFGP